MTDYKVILVSGASSGLGAATARYLFEKGYTVYAGARSYKTESTESNPDGRPGILHKVYLDVTDMQSIERLVADIIQREGKIDVLVNCAAIIILGSVEDISMEEFHRVISTNLYGMINMCKQVLPQMRAVQKGLIINFSSGAGIIGIPYQSAYSSSKFAIEGFSEVLRWEVKKHGIDVVLVEPGDCKSGSQTYRMHAQKADTATPYSEDFKNVTAKIDSDEANGSEPIKAAQVVYKIINKSKPGIRYNVMKAIEKMPLMKMLFPTWFIEWIFLDYYRLKPARSKQRE